jgi:exodeoxyribonuclease V beta subunit
MGLSENFHAEGLNELFRQYFPNEPDKHVVLTKHNIPHLYRYLRGEIDLVYEHAGKYYVVDYKSNYLGNSLSDYNEQTLSNAMSKAGYWLQAAIYQVALHRFLSIRIKDYIGHEDQYLGAVEYVFLRGALATSMEASDDSDDSEPVSQQRFGLVKWDIPIDFIKALDAAFGKPSR